MLDPVSNEDEGAGSGTGRVRAFSLVTCACWCRCRCMWWFDGVVSAVRARGLSGGCPPQLQDVPVRLLEVVEGAEEASLDAGHVLLWCSFGWGCLGPATAAPCTGRGVGWWGAGGLVPRG